MSKTNLVSFTPTDPFFFGGEQTFGSGSDKRANYFAASRYFPQQTTIIGVLRHALFEAGYKDKPGFGKSFVVGETADFGLLKSISPVFLKNETEALLPVRFPEKKKPNIAGQAEATYEPMNIALQSSSKEEVNFTGVSQTAELIAGYKQKHDVRDFLLSDADELKEYYSVFDKVTKTGIARDRQTHITLDGMFYRQELHNFKDGFSFACYVAGDEKFFEILKDRNMPIGGEKVNFVIKVHETEGGFENTFNKAFLKNRIDSSRDWMLLTSDAYVDIGVYEKCAFTMTDTISFCNIVTPDSNNFDGKMNQKRDSETTKIRYKSKKMTLLKRGTILFPKGNLSDLTVLFDNADEFRTIGYNQYFKNQKNQTI